MEVDLCFSMVMERYPHQTLFKIKETFFIEGGLEEQSVHYPETWLIKPGPAWKLGLLKLAEPGG